MGWLNHRLFASLVAGDELVATELIFGGVLAELEPEEAVALLAALVFQARRRPVLEGSMGCNAAAAVALAPASQRGGCVVNNTLRNHRLTASSVRSCTRCRRRARASRSCPPGWRRRGRTRSPWPWALGACSRSAGCS